MSQYFIHTTKFCEEIQLSEPPAAEQKPFVGLAAIIFIKKVNNNLVN